MRRYWLGVASYDHVKCGVSGGFCQLCHGKKAPLNNMRFNDVLLYYSPSNAFGVKDSFQSFTAIGKIMDNEAYQVEMHPGFFPFRRNIHYYPHITPANIHPLIPKLDFIVDKTYYGHPFRYGHLELSKKDAMCIWRALFGIINI